MRKTTGEKVFDIFNVSFFILCIIIMIFPFWNVLMTSMVTMGEYYSKPMILWPDEFSLESYKYIFSSDDLLRSLGWTSFYTIVGTLYSMLITVMLAYGLSKKYLPGRNLFITLIMIPMFFNGGLIPRFMLIRSLGLMNSVWVMILPTAVATMNFIIIKSFFSQLPESLEESAKIDGANELTVLFRIVLPLSLPVLATFTLFYGVMYWNKWFPALMYLTDDKLHPLQLVLRRMIDGEMSMDDAFKTTDAQYIFEDGVKMATVVVATAPILFVYPFLQKYFAKGVLLGSVKQ